MKSGIKLAILSAIIWLNIVAFATSYTNPELTQMQVFLSVLHLD